MTLTYILLGLTVLASLASFFLAARFNLLTWPVGLLGVLPQIALFAHTAILAEIFIQAPFVVVSFLGWRKWRTAEATGPLATQTMPIRRWFNTLFQVILATPFFALLLAYQRPRVATSSIGLPYLGLEVWPDAILLSLSLLALIHLARRLTYAWSLWILAILGYATLALYKNPSEGFVYLAFLPVCIYGQIAWIRRRSESATPSV